MGLVVTSGTGQQERFARVLRNKTVLLFFRVAFLGADDYQQAL